MSVSVLARESRHGICLFFINEPLQLVDNVNRIIKAACGQKHKADRQLVTRALSVNYVDNYYDL